MRGSVYKIWLIAVIMILSFAAATTTAFAWVSMQQNAAVDGFSMQIRGTDDLLISADGVKYSETLSTADFDSVFPRVLINDQGLQYGRFGLDSVTPLLDASGNPVFDSSGQPMFVSLNGDTNLYEPAQPYNKEDLSGSYFCFKLYFKASVPYDITIGYVEMASIASSQQDKVLSPIAFDSSMYSTSISGWISNEDVIPALAQNAARIAFKSSITRTSLDGAYFIIDPRSNSGYNIGNLARDYINYKFGNPWELTGDVIPVGYSDSEYDLSGATTKYIRETDVIEASSVLREDNYKNTELVRLTADGSGSYTGSLDVFFWIEGKDGDCFDSVMRDSFTLGIKFDGLLL